MMIEAGSEQVEQEEHLPDNRRPARDGPESTSLLSVARDAICGSEAALAGPRMECPGIAPKAGRGRGQAEDRERGREREGAKREERREKREARSEKREARSEKREARPSVFEPALLRHRRALQPIAIVAVADV
eukprot:3808162-Rhodomonas_salina.1